MPITLPTSSCTGRTDDSSTSTTRLDFSSPMPSAICDPYTLISTQTMTTVNRPVSRDDSDVDGCLKAVHRQRHSPGDRGGGPGDGLDQLGQAGQLGQRAHGAGHAAQGDLLDDDLLVGDQDRAQLPVAQRRLRRRPGSAAAPRPPGRRPAGRPRPRCCWSSSGRRRRRRCGPGRCSCRTGWRAAPRPGRPRSADGGRDDEDPGLGPQPDFPAGDQPGHVQADGWRLMRGSVVGAGSYRRSVAIARSSRWAACSSSAWPTDAPVAWRKTSDSDRSSNAKCSTRPRRPGEIQDGLGIARAREGYFRGAIGPDGLERRRRGR